MLDGTARAADEVVAIMPPALVECTVEKVAVNAVMAGCRPEYLPVVLAALEAVCTDEFNMHGVLATTMSVGPILVGLSIAALGYAPLIVAAFASLLASLARMLWRVREPRTAA